MAIANMDQLIGGMIAPRFFFKQNPNASTNGRLATYWATAGAPGAGAYDTTLAGVALTAPITGQIPFTDPAGGLSSYLAGFAWSGPLGSSYAPIILADRLWHNGGFSSTSTSAQTINSVAWPSRDANGLTDGEGVLLAVEVSAAMGAGTPTITVSYTNSAGTSGRTGTNYDTQGITSATVDSVFRIGLQAGDKGVRSVQSLTLSASWISGTFKLIAYRPLAAALTRSANYSGCELNALKTGLPKMYNGSVPYMMLVAGGGSGQTLYAGHILVAQG